MRKIVTQSWKPGQFIDATGSNRAWGLMVMLTKTMFDNLGFYCEEYGLQSSIINEQALKNESLIWVHIEICNNVSFKKAACDPEICACCFVFPCMSSQEV